MNIEQLNKKYKLTDFFYQHKKEDFTHKGFTFKKGEYYELIQDEGGITLYDDLDVPHDGYDEIVKRGLSGHK